MGENYKEVYIENKLDYGKYILDPEAKQRYADINKDMSTSHLSRQELQLAHNRQEIINIMAIPEHRMWLPRSFEAFDRDQSAMFATNRSKEGFQSKLERSNLTGETTDTKTFEKEKNKTIFGKSNA